MGISALKEENSTRTAWLKLRRELYSGRNGCVFVFDRKSGTQTRINVRDFHYVYNANAYTPNIYWGLGYKHDTNKKAWQDKVAEYKKTSNEYGVNWAQRKLDAYIATEPKFNNNSVINKPELSDKYRRLADNIELVNTLALDIDHYKHYGWLKPMDFFYGHIESLIGSVLPPPSYIEYGYGLRLIWVFAEPIKLKKGTTEKRSDRPIIKAYEATVKKFSDAVNKELGVIVCEPHKLNSFYRIPGSRNEKTWDVVELEEYSEERYTLQEMMDEYLPELPKWYVDRDVVAVKKNKKITRVYNQYQLWYDRMLKIEKIAETETAINRQNLCFLYLNGLMQMGYEGELMDAVLAFNSRLIEPLPEKELKSKLGGQIRRDKVYNLSNDKINELIGIEAFTKAKWTKREREKARKETNGATRKQIADNNRQKVLELKEKGLTTKEIAEIVGLKPQSVKNIVGKARKEAIDKTTPTLVPPGPPYIETTHIKGELFGPLPLGSSQGQATTSPPCPGRFPSTKTPQAKSRAPSPIKQGDTDGDQTA